MIKEFNTYLEKMDSEYWSRLCREYGSIKRYRKGEDIILIGTVAKYIGLIKSGSVKYIAYNFEMEEKVVGLETVGGFAASWPYCLHNIPSVVTIVANSDVEMYCLAVTKINELAKENPEVERQIANSTEQVFYTAYERLISLYTQAPKERYEDLLNKCPRLFDIFSLKDIASYLNITPTHLSRLRND